MTDIDRRPLPNTPATARIAQRADNRIGAVISSRYQFWTARDTAIRAGSAAGMRRDAYTIITFDSNPQVPTEVASNSMFNYPLGCISQ